LGAVPLNLSDVFLASAASGKALGACAGLALVFANERCEPAPVRLPAYLDLGSYANADGVPFTLSSNLVYALQAALPHADDAHRQAIARLAKTLREGLRGINLAVLCPDALASPAVTTIALPPQFSGVWLGHRLEDRGIAVSYNTSYLVERNWVQICLMGDCQASAVSRLLAELRAVVQLAESASTH
jgi:aspartate aminotransferase-like enzyme